MMIWEKQNCKTRFLSLKNIQAPWGKMTPEWHKTVCVRLESVIRCSMQSENLVLKCVNRNWEDKKMATGSTEKRWAELPFGGSHHLTYLMLSPAPSCFFSKLLTSREPSGVTRNLSSKVSSKNSIVQPVFCICSQEDYETLCQRCFWRP